MSLEPDVIQCNCPNGHLLKTPPHLAGKRGKCPKCGATFVIPSGRAVNVIPPAQLKVLQAEKTNIFEERDRSDWAAFSTILPGFFALFLQDVFAPIMSFVAIALVAVGVAFAAHYKGQTPYWGLTAILCFFPALIVAFLADVKGARIAEINKTVAPYLSKADLRQEQTALLEQRKQMQMLSLVLGVPGLLIPVAILFSRANPADAMAPFLIVLLFISVTALTTGFACAAKYRGRSACWGLWGVFHIFGALFILARPDLHKTRLAELEKALGEPA